MMKGLRITYILFFAFLIITLTACAPARKNTYYQKRQKSSRVDASMLGRNKYYISSGYQKKLNRSYKKR